MGIRICVENAFSPELDNFDVMWIHIEYPERIGDELPGFGFLRGGWNAFHKNFTPYAPANTNTFKVV